MSGYQRLINWGLSAKILSSVRNFLVWLFSRFNLEMVSHGSSQKLPVMKMIRRIKGEAGCSMGDQEAYAIYMAVKNSLKIKGDLAEVGIYKGGSAKIICEAKGGRRLHLFDTFEGCPELSEVDYSSKWPYNLYKGQFKSSYKEVKRYLSKYANVHIYKGLFPETASSIKKRRFAFVHLDVDIYESTLSCLKFFYPRINKGGVLISHDYSNVPGVKKAVDEFFKGKKEVVLESGSSQCMVMKI